MDLGGALRQARNLGKVTAKIISATLDQNLHTGANMEYQALPTVDVLMASTGDVVVAELNAALGECRKSPWKEKAPAKAAQPNSNALTMGYIAQTLRDQFNDPGNVTFCTLGRGWPFDIWPLQNGMAYLGKDGGGGLGSGPGISVGSALALHHHYPDRYAISMLGDGDFCMGATAIWSAVKHRIPLLVLINNNRSYFNDELHKSNEIEVASDKFDKKEVDLAKKLIETLAGPFEPGQYHDEYKQNVEKLIESKRKGRKGQPRAFHAFHCR